MAKSNPSLYRALHKLHTGGLHRALGISEDKDIPHEKKVAASHSKNKHVAAMGRLALTFEGFHHGSEKKK